MNPLWPVVDVLIVACGVLACYCYLYADKAKQLREQVDYWEGQATAEDQASEEVERLRAILAVATEQARKQRERVKQLQWEKSHIWRWILDGAGEAE